MLTITDNYYFLTHMGKSNIQELVILDYYPGSYGPTIRIDVPNETLMSKVTQVFKDLALGQSFKIEFHSLNFVVNIGLSGLELRTDNTLRKSFETKTLKRIGRKLPRPSFTWVRTAEGWMECLEKAEVLNTPAHQYLTIENLDDALVELSFCESSPELREHILNESRK